MQALDPQAARASCSSYPSNPTAMVVDLDFYTEAVALAKKLDLIILSDLAYAEIYFDDNPPPSVLQVPGAMDIAVEFTSLSKTYNMPGWRMGFAVGNERLIAALARIKSYLDYGAFTPIQVAAAAALNGPQECVEEIRADLQAPPRLPRRDASSARAGRSRRRPPPCSPGRRSRERFRESRIGGILQAADRESRHRGVARAWASASMVKASFASRSSRTSTASARPRGNLKKFLAQAPETMHNVIPIPQKASR